jgi:transcriptional regulator with XRE-family HTH domain
MSDYLPLSEQLNILFEVVTHPSGRPFTLNEVSEPTDLSLATISQMRNGKIKNPQLNTLRELCRFFNVPLRYFETTSPAECYALLTGNTDKITPEINEIAFRASNLSPKSQRDLLTVIKWVQAAEAQQKEGHHLPPLPGLEDYDDARGSED